MTVTPKKPRAKPTAPATAKRAKPTPAKRAGVRAATGRRAHANSVTAAIEIARDAKVAIAPPATACLVEKHMPYWAEIISSRSVPEWDAVSLQLAAQLARLFAQAAEVQGVLDRNGLFLTNGDPHPGNRLLLEVGSKAQALMRSLQIAPNQTAGRAASNVNRRDAERKARSLDAERDNPKLRYLANDDGDLLA